MIRVFIQTMTLLVPVLLGALWIQSTVFDYLIVQSQRQNQIDFRQRFTPIFYFVELELAKSKEEDWPQVIEKHSAGFPLGGQLVDLNRVVPNIKYPVVVSRLEQREIALWDDGGSNLYLGKLVGNSGKVFLLKYPNPPSLRRQSAIWGFAIEFSILALVVAVLVFLLWRDVTKLTVASEKVGRGIYDFDLKVGRTSALRPFATSFNAMRDRVAEHVAAQRELIHSISHEFRTPLARIRFRQEFVRNATTAQERNEQLALMETSIDELDELATEILEYSRMDSGFPELQLEEIECGPWLDTIVAEESPPTLRSGHPCSVQLDIAAATLHGDAKFLRRAVSNLLRNAFRYANNKIVVAVMNEGSRISVIVEDDGPGIPKENWSRIFNPFVRVDGSRGRQSGGFGIGLAIVRQIAKMHGGDVLIDVGDLGGAKVGFWVPEIRLRD